MNRVVVTGIGAVSPIGNSLDEIWANAKAGRSGIAPVATFDVSDIPWKVAGMVQNLSVDTYLDPKEIIRLDPFVHYAVAASLTAITSAGLERSSLLKYGGVIIGSSRGGISTIEKALRRKYLLGKSLPEPAVSAYLMPATTISMAASYVAQKCGITGHCLGISNACASGLCAIGEGYRLIRSGYNYPILCGGAEAPVCRICIEGYGISGALSKGRDAAASRPFDKMRDGFVLAEGACIVILENFESAVARGAKIFGEIIGYGNTTDAHHQTIPFAEGEAQAMRSALSEAGLNPRDIHFISAHGTSTRLGDRTETEAIKKAFGKYAYNIPVTSLKSVTGHMLAASGALEAALSLMGLREGLVTPTAHLQERDPECDLDYVTECRPIAAVHALSQSFGFGGLNAVLVFRREGA